MTDVDAISGSGRVFKVSGKSCQPETFAMRQKYRSGVGFNYLGTRNEKRTFIKVTLPTQLKP